MSHLLEFARLYYDKRTPPERRGFIPPTDNPELAAYLLRLEQRTGEMMTLCGAIIQMMEEERGTE